ncbi:MAG TPA: FAD-binding oxidoreductase [Polyangia bacterium]|nr:FAD-binding oxidoreductase [Polyangia bacterium]
MTTTTTTTAPVIATVTAAAAAGGARPGGAADAVAGVVPAVVVAPQTIDEAVALIAAGARDGQRLVFMGGGTEIGLGAPPQGLDVVMRTSALDRVVEHAPLDQIVTVECGVRLAALQQALAAHGQMLALDPPWAERATVGGIVASNAFGARRTRYGSVRDLIIGISFVRADGTLARAGGKVVKNVAGFDLAKLLTGSLGTLGLIATATFRLHPLPESSATVYFPDGAAADVRRVIAAARAAQLEPDAAAVLIDHDAAAAGGDGAAAGNRRGDGWQLGVRFAGFARAVAQQRDRLVEVGRALGLDVRPLDDDAAAEIWERHRVAREAPAGFRAKLAMLPADPDAAQVIARLRAPLRSARTVFYPTLGLGFVTGDVGDAAPDIAAAVHEARGRLAASGGTVVVHEAPAPVRARLDVWGVPGDRHSPLPLMRSVKARLDPQRRLAPGRLVGGI